MEYELAIQLKNAGLPQDREGQYVFRSGYICSLDEAAGSIHADGENAYLPTLSELIAACGERFWYLRKYTGKDWKAATNDTRKDYFREGSTPEEAVARLWLAINL